MRDQPERVLRMQTEPAAPGPLLDDAAKIREAAGRHAVRDRTTTTARIRRPAEASPPAGQELPPAASPEEEKFYGEQLINVWNQLAVLRGWPAMPGPPVDPKTGMPKPPNDPEVFARQVGAPLAKAVPQVLAVVDQRPWLQVLLVCTPFVLGAVRIEAQRIGVYLHERQAAARGRPQRDHGADRPGQDGPDAGADSGFTPGLGADPDR